MGMTTEEVAAIITNDAVFWAKTLDEKRRRLDIARRKDELLAQTENLLAELLVLDREHCDTLRDAIEALTGAETDQRFFEEVGTLLTPIAKVMEAELGVTGGKST